MVNPIDPKALDAWIRSALKFMRVRPEELDDAAQDTWIALLARNKLTGARSPKAYVEAAARNSLKDKIRYKRANKRDAHNTIYLEAYIHCTEAAEKPEKLHANTVDIEKQMIDRQGVVDAISDAYRSLDARRWQVIRMKAHGYTQQETVQATGLSTRQVARVSESIL